MEEIPKRPSMTKAELEERLAAALAQLWGIPYETRKTMTAQQIIGMGQCDHGIHHAIGGPNVHWNYTWLLTPEHREKTSKVDVPQIAKTKRIIKKQAAHEARIALSRVESRLGVRPPVALLRNTGAGPDQGGGSVEDARPVAPKMQSRPMPGTRRSGLKRTMRGEVIRRDK